MFSLKKPNQASNEHSRLWGVACVSLAAFLWATDALVRFPALGHTSPGFLVLVEHVLACVLLLPQILVRYGGRSYKLSKQAWLSALFCGSGGSALGTLLFTESFKYINPSVAILLQKLQPFLVIILAYFILNEKPSKKFYFWGLLALASGVVLSFPDLRFGFLTEGFENKKSFGMLLAFSSALIWSGSTISGKLLLEQTPADLATFWRFFFGMITMIVIFYFGDIELKQAIQAPWQEWVSILYLSLVPGIFAMIIYYAGLARTPANISTFIELLYPVAAVVLNTLFLQTPLDPVQIGAACALLLCVAVISF